ncbi:uncharacterized protein F4807DRAFT_468123 [Annulohypoxylon truncatum]|uniref:uncharacterized protein n=1 Tax=Annulohypoxylon truncatum TaxID=327061 RepID=UPI0020081803|nr:uncharacterized protein F4807DRAFT_468123 [Annulohypoxylon truncatum]KAI1214175.1 hypothetical protein F4807DRAFT_468123 [Annulohypoxylon truncatum]
MAPPTPHVTALRELIEQMPFVKGDQTIENAEARLHLRHVQQCVWWALKHKASLTILGGGHSGHCVEFNVVAVDMGAFGQVHILKPSGDGEESGPESGPYVVAEAGCKTGDIVGKAMAEGLTVPLGTGPSVGAGSWLQGGIGHLARLRGLACDAIVGAVLVRVDSGDVVYVGSVPSQHRPAGAVRPETHEADLLWAIKGAGTNFGIVVSVTFKAYAAPTYLRRNWIFPLKDDSEAQHGLRVFDKFAQGLPRHISAEAYLYWYADQLHLEVTSVDASVAVPEPRHIKLWGVEDKFKYLNGVDLLDTGMSMSRMHGGTKTSSLKRCFFLKRTIGASQIVSNILGALETRPSPFCYIQIMLGGEAVGDIAANATAFGCRDWTFACVVAGVWPRDEDGTETAQAAVQWVYDVAKVLLPKSDGVYSADLGPGHRDAALATKAFGPNISRLSRLKRNLDPHNVLAHTCPVPKALARQKLIMLVTGETYAGKDHCARIWASFLTTYTEKKLTTRVVSISDATKREYASTTGADLDRLLNDRSYKEQHRAALTAFFEDQVRQRPKLLEENFLDVVRGAVDVDVLLITGMRDEAPVAKYWRLVPESRLIEVRIEIDENTLVIRRACDGFGMVSIDNKANKDGSDDRSSLKPLNYRPGFVFDNDTNGDREATRFAEKYLLPFFDEDLQRLADMVPLVPGFPCPEFGFHHVLDIAQQPGGLTLCVDLLETHFTMDELATVDAVASCETGGFIFAAALAKTFELPLVLIRKGGKLPPPTVSNTRLASHVSSLVTDDSEVGEFEMNRYVVSRGTSVLVVDDVLASGRTLCAMLDLLVKSGVRIEDVSVMIVAEFPVHGGRALLCKRGFGGVMIRSLLVFGGA